MHRDRDGDGHGDEWPGTFVVRRATAQLTLTPVRGVSGVWCLPVRRSHLSQQCSSSRSQQSCTLGRLQAGNGEELCPGLQARQWPAAEHPNRHFAYFDSLCFLLFGPLWSSCACFRAVLAGFFNGVPGVLLGFWLWLRTCTPHRCNDLQV